MPRLECRELSKTFGAVQALHEVNLQLEPGELAVLEGPSGSGKTTLLRLIAGLELPDSGTVALDGGMATAPGVYLAPARRGIGMVFQDFALWPHKTVAGHVQFVLRARRVARPQRQHQVQRLLELVELTEKQRSYPAELSGGQQQRVAIARALAADPPLLLLDEPFSNLDQRLSMRIAGEFAARLRAGAAIVWATHHAEDVPLQAQHVLRLGAQGEAS